MSQESGDDSRQNQRGFRHLGGSLSPSRQWASVAGLVHFATAAGASLVQLSLLASYLPGNVAGLWVLAMTLANYLAFFDFGFGPTLTREISYLSVGLPGEHEANARKAGDLLATGSLATSALCGLAFVLGIFVGRDIVWRASPDDVRPEVLASWPLFVTGVVMSLKANTFFAAIEGLGAIGRAKGGRALAAALGPAILAGAMSESPGSLAVGIAVATQGAITLGLSILLLKGSPAQVYHGTFRPAALRKLAKPSFEWALTGAGALLLFQVSNLVIAARLPLEDVLKFDALMRVGRAFLGLALTPVMSTTAIMSALHAEGRVSDEVKLVTTNCRHAVTSMAIMSVSWAVFHDAIIELWLGKAYVPPSVVVYVLLAMFMLETVHLSLATCAMAAGYVRFYVPALVGGVLNSALAVALVASYGLAGVAMALCLSQVLTNNWFVSLVSLRVLRVSLTQYLRQVIIRAFFAIGCSIGLCVILKLATRDWALSSQVAAVVALTAALLLAFGRSEYAIWRRLARSDDA